MNKVRLYTIRQLALAGCLFLAACTAANVPQTPHPTKSVIPTETPTPEPSPTSMPPLSTQAGAFEVAASNFRRQDDQLYVDVCINLPDSQDWMVGRASLQVGGALIDQSGSQNINYQPARADGTPGRRCDSLYFDLPINPEATQAILTIEKISAYPREGQYCAYLLETVQKILDERQTGIRLECSEKPGNSDAKVASKPASLSQAQAEAIAFSDEFYSVAGPWIFSSEAVSELTSIPTAALFPTVSLDDTQASPYALLQTLNQKADASLATPGWVYTQENWQHDIDAGSYATLANGVPLPDAYMRETWYLLDESGRVIKSLSLVYTSKGEILETSIFTNNQTWSSSAPQRVSQQPYRLHLNELYTGNVQANLRQGVGSAGKTELDGQSFILFTLEEGLQNPNPSQYSQPIQGDVVSTYFDPNTGQLRFLKTVVSLADGSKRALEQMQLMVQSGGQPPASVLEMLQGINEP